MDINEIEKRLKLKRMELQIEKDYNKKQEIQNEIQVLEFRRQIELIKKKIQRMTR